MAGNDVVYAPIFGTIWEYAKALPGDEGSKLIMACCAYSFGEEMPELEGMTKTIFELTAKPLIDKSLAIAKRNRANGRKRVSAEEKCKSEPEPSACPPPPEPEPKQEPLAIQTEPKPEPDASQSEAKSCKKKEERRKKKEERRTEGRMGTQSVPAHPRQRFQPPSIVEVQAYSREFCQERGIPPGKFDAERFCDYYESNGWKVGKNPMKSWKAAVRTWIGKDITTAQRQEVSSSHDVFSAYE